MRLLGRAVQRHARQAYSALLEALSRRLAAAPSPLSTIVFAPHPDDETLACGGTVLRKRLLNADVTIVFMTDGAASHPGAIDPAVLRGRRRTEAVEAASVLGVGEDDLVFLDFPDGRLAENVAAATERVRKILERSEAAEIFIPYAADVHQDHVATNRIVHAALRQIPPGRRAVVFEYPVWFLYHWPLVEISAVNPLRAAHVLGASFVRAAVLIRDFRSIVSIGEWIDVKRAALDRHRSQTSKGDPGGPTIADKSNGAFLRLFLGNYERFKRVGY